MYGQFGGTIRRGCGRLVMTFGRPRTQPCACAAAYNDENNKAAPLHASRFSQLAHEHFISLKFFFHFSSHWKLWIFVTLEVPQV
jgi:hypothetical protein